MLSFHIYHIYFLHVCRCSHEGTPIWATAVCQMAVQQDCLHDVNSARWVHADCPQTWKRRLKTQLCHHIQQQHGCGGSCRSDAATIWCHVKDTAVVQKANAASAASKPVECIHRLQAYFAVKDGLPHIPVWGHYIAALRRSASTRSSAAQDWGGGSTTRASLSTSCSSDTESLRVNQEMQSVHQEGEKEGYQLHVYTMPQPACTVCVSLLWTVPHPQGLCIDTIHETDL